MTRLMTLADFIPAIPHRLASRDIRWLTDCPECGAEIEQHCIRANPHRIHGAKRIANHVARINAAYAIQRNRIEESQQAEARMRLDPQLRAVTERWRRQVAKAVNGR